MRSLITAIVPMIVLFAIPVLIPIVTVAVGTLADRFRPAQRTAAEEAVAAAQARSAPWRAEMQRLIAEHATEATTHQHVPPPPPSPHVAIAPGQAGQRPAGRIAA